MNNDKTSAESDSNQTWDKVMLHLKSSLYKREKDELIKFPMLLGKAKTFVDIGASLGPYTWMAHYSLSNATIHAIEANYHLCRHIEKEWEKVETSGMTRGNKLIITNGAIYDQYGVINFEIDVANFLNSHVADSKEESASNGEREMIEAPCVILDELFSDSDPDLIKLDVEGAEWRALNGGRKLLARGKTTFLVEIHPWGDGKINKKPSDIFSIFRQYGYHVSRYNQHWLFKKGNGIAVNRLTSIGYGYILDRPWIKRIAKKILRSLS